MRHTRSIVLGLGAAGVLIAAALTSVLAQSRAASRGSDHQAWSAYLGAADSAQYSALRQITASNVAKLEVAWTFPAGRRTFMFGPLVADWLAFVLVGANDLVAL